MPPRIEYFTQMKVVSVSSSASGYTIDFDGGGAIYNRDKRFRVPDEIQDTTLLEVDNYDDQAEEPRANLKFGYSQVVNGEAKAEVVSEVSINLNDYAISDPRFPAPAGGVWTAEAIHALPSDDAPPDPSAERVADGPAALLTASEDEDES